MKNVFFLCVVLALFSCKENTTAEVKTAPTQKGNKTSTLVPSDLNATEANEKVTFKTEEASQIHAAYLELKGAFVNTNATDAAEMAKEFKQMLGAATETKVIERLNVDLESIATSNKVSEQRIAFENVSKNVEMYLSGQITSGTIYKQYCPMAFSGKGAYWLSDSKEIRNPYYGDKMLKCGVVDKEIQ